MEIKRLKECIKFMNENQLCELEIEEEGRRIRLKKFSQEQPVVIAQTTAPVPAQEKEPDRVDESLNRVEIKSPMVGTFYRAPSPTAKPYVEIGNVVKNGEVICIIEAMKLMNEIKAEEGGRIIDILVENGHSVEFSQPLFLIEPH